MPNQDIQEYIKTQRAAGVSDDAIKKALSSSGWSAEQISQAFPGDTSSAANGQLMGPIELVKTSFSIYKDRMFTYISILLIPYLIIFGIAALIGGSVVAYQTIDLSLNPVLIIVLVLVAIIVTIALVYISIWSQVAIMEAALSWKEKISINEAFSRSKSKISAFFTVSFLTSLIVAGGLLLLIIPGLLFAFWYMFSTYAVVGENMRGLAALKRSREYTKGRIWAILWRVLVVYVFIWLVQFVAGIVASSFDQEVVSSLISGIVSLFVGPFVVVYTVVLYQNLKSITPVDTTVVKGTGSMKLFMVLGILALLTVPIAIVALIALNPAKRLNQVKEMQSTSNLNALQTSIEMYKIENGNYPTVLYDLTPKYISSQNADEMFADYEYTADGFTYTLCTKDNGSQENRTCVDPRTRDFE